MKAGQIDGGKQEREKSKRRGVASGLFENKKLLACRRVVKMATENQRKKGKEIKAGR